MEYIEAQGGRSERVRLRGMRTRSAACQELAKTGANRVDRPTQAGHADFADLGLRDAVEHLFTLSCSLLLSKSASPSSPSDPPPNTPFPSSPPPIPPSLFPPSPSPPPLLLFPPSPSPPPPPPPPRLPLHSPLPPPLFPPPSFSLSPLPNHPPPSPPPPFPPPLSLPPTPPPPGVKWSRVPWIPHVRACRDSSCRSVSARRTASSEPSPIPGVGNELGTKRCASAEMAWNMT